MTNNTDSARPAPRRSIIWRNWVSLAGLVIATGSLFSFLLLFVLDSIAHFANPYIGVLTYLVAPGFLVVGLTLAGIGTLWHRHRLRVERRDEDTHLIFAVNSFSIST
jgi:hypothetical protein